MRNSQSSRGLINNKNYSSFWMDSKWNNQDKFDGLGTADSKNSDSVKLVKLVNYRKAIANFVKILTNKDIPVYWQGSDSHTNGKSITLSTNINENNFDVMVGLALHEGSHILLTDFSVLDLLQEGKIPEVNKLLQKHKTTKYASLVEYLHPLLNWIEDRRIDNFVFKTSPGYKAYYHKMYDYYWNNKSITKGLSSKEFSTPTIENYFFHIINMINHHFNPKTLPGLEEIVQLVNLGNISRLQNTTESLHVAIQIADIILQNTKDTQTTESLNQSLNQTTESLNQSLNQTTESLNQSLNQTTKSSNQSLNTNKTLTKEEEGLIKQAIDTQKSFLSSNVKKSAATKKLQASLDYMSKQQAEIQQINIKSNTYNCIVFDYVNSNAFNEYETHYKAYEQSFNDNNLSISAKRKLSDNLHEARPCCYMSPRQSYVISQVDRNTAILAQGYEIGSLLGKKIQLRNETRERVDNRLASGKIDKRRLAHAGYGITNVFHQISVDKYKKANLHISLDGSGSMSGQKWKSTIKLTMALARAAEYTQNIDVQVSIRVTARFTNRDVENTILLNIYDSRKNKLSHLIKGLKYFQVGGSTPEGLCFETMIKKSLLIPGTADLDSYFLNISDGIPGTDLYSGPEAINHTAAQVNHMRTTLNMSVISYFLYHDSLSNQDHSALIEAFSNSREGNQFRSMYGKDASVVDPNNAVSIAQNLNKRFLHK